MGRVRTLIAAASLLAFGPGCAATKLWKSDEPAKYPEGIATSPLSSLAAGNNGVIQASASVPAGPVAVAPPSQPSSMARMFGKAEKKAVADTITIVWRNKVDYLPDPSRNGEMGPGLVGQVFLFDSKMQPAPAEGKLIVALYDESPRPPGQEANKPEGWEFTKETLKGLRGYDERWGPCYIVFLPWPTYRPDVSRVRIATRYEPESGPPMFVPESRVTLDNSTIGANAANWTKQTFTPGGEAQPAGGFNALGGPPPATGTSSGPGLGVLTQPGFAPTGGNAPPTGFVPPAPPNFGAVAPVGPGPNPSGGPPVNTANLPPIAFTAPRPTGR